MHLRYLVPEGADLDDGLGADLFKPGGEIGEDRGAPWLRRDGPETVGGRCAQLGDESVG
jgi:hypothetical protein